MKISISNENKITAARGMTGLFIEDINYAIDGGLYAEMLENANFEARDVSGKWDNYRELHDCGYGWEAFPSGDRKSVV